MILLNSYLGVSQITCCFCNILSPTLILLFNNDLLSSASSPIHSYADDSTLHLSPSTRSLPQLLVHILETLPLPLSTHTRKIFQTGKGKPSKILQRPNYSLFLSLVILLLFDIIFEDNVQ